jgi:hypothetical protein
MLPGATVAAFVAGCTAGAAATAAAALVGVAWLAAASPAAAASTRTTRMVAVWLLLATGEGDGAEAAFLTTFVAVAAGEGATAAFADTLVAALSPIEIDGEDGRFADACTGLAPEVAGALLPGLLLPALLLFAAAEAHGSARNPAQQQSAIIVNCHEL